MKKLLEPGTISHATMREEDLIPRFMAALRSVDPEREQTIREENKDVLEALEKEERTDSEQDQISMFLNECLFDVLQEYCPEGYYFGSHPGDGSDYGVWEEEENDLDS